MGHPLVPLEYVYGWYAPLCSSVKKQENLGHPPELIRVQFPVQCNRNSQSKRNLLGAALPSYGPQFVRCAAMQYTRALAFIQGQHPCL
jgi:hypothetical protein